MVFEVLTRTHNWTVSWARLIGSTSSKSVSFRSILILSSHLHLCFPSYLISSGFTIIRATWSSYLILRDLIIWVLPARVPFTFREGYRPSRHNTSMYFFRCWCIFLSNLKVPSYGIRRAWGWMSLYLLSFYASLMSSRSRNSSVTIVTRLCIGRLRNRSSIAGKGNRFVSSPQRPDRLWGPPSVLSNGHHGLFARGQNGQCVKLTTHVPLVPRPGMVELYLHSPIRLYCVLN
jgi:hypothetical protein